MEPEIITRESFKIVGIRYLGANKNNEIGQLWGDFHPRVKEIKNIVFGASYGYCGDEEMNEKGEFEYVAGLEVSKVEDVPEGMVVREVPAAKFAVFTHRGLVTTLKDTYDYIYQTWLPKSGYERPVQIDMEVYDAKFIPNHKDSIMYIYIPIK